MLAFHLLAVFVQLVFEVAFPFALRTAFTCRRFRILAFGGRTLLGPTLDATVAAHTQLTAGREVGAMQIDRARNIAELNASGVLDDLQALFGVFQLLERIWEISFDFFSSKLLSESFIIREKTETHPIG